MSRTPGTFSLPIVRGATWEDDFVYKDADGNPIDLTGYEARMQIRTLAGQYGTSTTATLLLSLTTTGADPLLTWDTAATGRVVAYVRPDQHAALNPTNAKKAKYAYWLEFYKPDPSGTGEYVLPIVKGKITANGTGYRA